MVVNYLHVLGLSVLPTKHDTPLVVDPDRMKSFSITFKCFKSIARRHSKVLELGRIMQIQKSPPGDAA
jgi:hypothetical protein